MCQLLADNRKISHFKRELVMLRHYCSLFFIKWIVVYHGEQWLRGVQKAGRTLANSNLRISIKSFKKCPIRRRFLFWTRFFVLYIYHSFFLFWFSTVLGWQRKESSCEPLFFQKNVSKQTIFSKLDKFLTASRRNYYSLFFYLLIYTFHVSLSFFHSLIRKSRSRSLASSPCFVGR